MKHRWISQSRISKTSHQRPAPHSGRAARHGPSRCSPWLVPSATTTSLPEKTQLKCVIDLIVPPTSPKSSPEGDRLALLIGHHVARQCHEPALPGHSPPFSIYSAQGGLRQDPGHAA